MYPAEIYRAPRSWGEQSFGNLIYWNEVDKGGHFAAVPLGEVFSFEVTTAEYACNGCGRVGRLGGAMVFEVRELGTIVRCPGCDNGLIRLAHNRGQYMADFGGMRYFTTG